MKPKICYQCGGRIEMKEACLVRRRWTCQACVQRMIDALRRGGYDGTPRAQGQKEDT